MGIHHLLTGIIIKQIDNYINIIEVKNSTTTLIKYRKQVNYETIKRVVKYRGKQNKNILVYPPPQRKLRSNSKINRDIIQMKDGLRLTS